MKLRQWNYDLGPSGGFDHIDYPDEIIAPFVEFFRDTKLWLDNMDVISHKALVLERALTEHRNKMAVEAAEARLAEAEQAQAQATVGAKEKDEKRAYEIDALPKSVDEAVEAISEARSLPGQAGQHHVPDVTFEPVASESDATGSDEPIEPVTHYPRRTVEGLVPRPVLGAAASLSDEDKKSAGLPPG